MQVENTRELSLALPSSSYRTYHRLLPRVIAGLQTSTNFNDNDLQHTSTSNHLRKPPSGPHPCSPSARSSCCRTSQRQPYSIPGPAKHCCWLYFAEPSHCILPANCIQASMVSAGPVTSMKIPHSMDSPAVQRPGQDFTDLYSWCTVSETGLSAPYRSSSPSV